MNPRLVRGDDRSNLLERLLDLVAGDHSPLETMSAIWLVLVVVALVLLVAARWWR